MKMDVWDELISSVCPGLASSVPFHFSMSPSVFVFKVAFGIAVSCAAANAVDSA